MNNKTAKQKRPSPKRVLRLPDLDYAKTAVLNTLSSPDSRRSYRFAIDDFVTWYCSEPRLAFSKTVVLRYRLELEGRHLAPSTINLRLAAVRRLAYEAADTGLLSPDLAAGIRRVKGAKKVGVRLGNWLTADQAKALLRAPDIEKVRGKRDRAMLAVLLGCGLRRSELVHLNVNHFQQREDDWAIVDLIGKGGHIRTVPVPDWVKASIDDWATVAHIGTGRLFRCVNKTGSVWGSGITEKVVWSVVKEFAGMVGIDKLAPHDLRRYAESRIMPNRQRCGPTRKLIGHWATRHSLDLVRPANWERGPDATGLRFSKHDRAPVVKPRRVASFDCAGRTAQTAVDDVEFRCSAFCRVLRPPDYAASFSRSILLDGHTTGLEPQWSRSDSA